MAQPKKREYLVQLDLQARFTMFTEREKHGENNLSSSSGEQNLHEAKLS